MKLVSYHTLYKQAKDLLSLESFAIIINCSQNEGIGNVLLPFFTFFSINENTKVRGRSGYVLGDYSLLLDESHIYKEGDPMMSLRVEYVNSHEDHRLSMLKSEEVEYLTLYATIGVKRRFNKYGMKNSDLKPYFSPYNVDEVLNRSLIPSSMVKRVLGSIRRVKFKQKLIDRANALTDGLIHPSLGISVRSWTASHEKHENLSHLDYSQSKYEKVITDIILSHSKHIKSLLIAFDNPDLVMSYKPFLDRLQVQVFYFSHAADVTPIEKGFIEILSLSKTNYLIGDSRSGFIRTIFWMGECRQYVLHPDKQAMASMYFGASLTGAG